jgi:hypothetical protein
MAIGKSRAQKIRKNFRANYGPKPKITTSDVKGRRGAVKAGQSTYMKKDGTVGKLTRTQKLRTMKNLNKKAKTSAGSAVGKLKPPTGLPSTGSGATKANPGKAAPLPQKPNLGNNGITRKKPGVGGPMTPPTKMRGGGMMKAAAKKKMMRGGTVKPKTTKMAGGGMMKVAKKKMMRGGAVKKK